MGHQFTDDNGKYKLETVIPGEYPGRTVHIHVKLRANDGSPVLTTQLYFPGVAANESDFIFKEELLVKMSESGAGGAGEGADQSTQVKIATFNFVIKK